MSLPRVLIALGVVGAIAALISLPDLLRSDRAASVAPIEIETDGPREPNRSKDDRRDTPRKRGGRQARSGEGGEPQASQGTATEDAPASAPAPQAGSPPSGSSPSPAPDPSPNPQPAPTPPPAPVPDDDDDDDFEDEGDDSVDDGDSD